MFDLTNKYICSMRKVAFNMAKSGVSQKRAEYALSRIMDNAYYLNQDDEIIIFINELEKWPQTFIADYFEKPLTECKTCKATIPQHEQKGDVCENCI